MVRDAERYKEEDDKQRDRLQAKNALESYAFNMKQTIEDDKLKDKISEDDRKTVLDKCNEMIQWLDGNQVSLAVKSVIHFYAVAHREGAISVAFVRLSVAYIANNLRSQRPGVPKFGRNVRCDSHTSFKVKWSKVRVRGGRGHTVSSELAKLVKHVF